MQNPRVIARERDAESEKLDLRPRNLKRQLEERRAERERERVEDKG